MNISLDPFKCRSLGCVSKTAFDMLTVVLYLIKKTSIESSIIVHLAST